ncbi:MAG TPA: Mov34/MPN/PAD-1 family protein [Thermoanaerobaculia bacterium]
MLALVLATVIQCGDLCGRHAWAHYADLLELGGYGRLPVERGGFLIREADGSITMAMWDSRGYKRATYRGAIPERTIAIVHTHPRTAPHPSMKDRDEARRNGLPVLVVTPGGVVGAMPDGSVVVIGRG